MILPIPKILLLKSFRSFGFPKVLPLNYTFLISTACNSRCKTCRIYKQKHHELSLDEWEKILKSFGHSPFWITLTGGEPFLNPNLVDLCRKIFTLCQPHILTIPTNSLLWKTIPKKTETILKRAEKTQVILNLSLDGVGSKHDQIRGVKGSFIAFQKNYCLLKKLKNKYPNLTLGIHSVISRFNAKDANNLFDYVFSLAPDQYITEIAEQRVELDTVGLKITPSFQEYSKAINPLIQKLSAKKFKKLSKITEAFRLEYYDFVKRWLKAEKIQMKDYAGWASCEIASWGEVWPSCIHGINFGNLRNVNYDFSKIWFGKKAQNFRKKYKRCPESFPLANAFYTNALMHFPTLINVAKRILK